jgi:hypothetical protein
VAAKNLILRRKQSINSASLLSFALLKIIFNDSFSVKCICNVLFGGITFIKVDKISTDQLRV